MEIISFEYKRLSKMLITSLCKMIPCVLKQDLNVRRRMQGLFEWPEYSIEELR